MPAERPQRAEHTEREIEAVARALFRWDHPSVDERDRGPVYVDRARLLLAALDRVRDARNDDEDAGAWKRETVAEIVAWIEREDKERGDWYAGTVDAILAGLRREFGERDARTHEDEGENA